MTWTVLNAKGLGYKRSRRHNWLFDNFDIEAKMGEIVIVYGEISTGKTELIDMLAGLKPIKKGSVEKQGGTAVMQQNFYLYKDLKVSENLDFFSSINNFPIAKLPKIMDQTGLTNFSNVKAFKLPPGIKKMLQLACAVVKDYSLILMDEPTTGLDSHYNEVFWNYVNLLKSEGKAILITTNDKSILDKADKVYTLSQSYSKEKQAEIIAEENKDED